MTSPGTLDLSALYKVLDEIDKQRRIVYCPNDEVAEQVRMAIAVHDLRGMFTVVTSPWLPRKDQVIVTMSDWSDVDPAFASNFLRGVRRA